MNISHDKESGALYIRLRDGEYDHTEDLPGRADVYLDVDRAGNVLGLEALSFEDLAQAIEDRGGGLDVPDRLRYLTLQLKVPEQDQIWAALASLDPREREILRLRYHGLEDREVAERLGISVSTSHRLHKAAITKLRAALQHGDQRPGEDERSGEPVLEDALSLLASA